MHKDRKGKGETQARPYCSVKLHENLDSIYITDHLSTTYCPSTIHEDG
jgi:hypothetical protein